MASISLLSLPS